MVVREVPNARAECRDSPRRLSDPVQNGKHSKWRSDLTVGHRKRSPQAPLPSCRPPTPLLRARLFD
ncbi:Thymidylate synthase [Clarias magur]|uniref:Thymidylate synthase n=1 Tax=Clarias magur TaxID=1594786 RepID=A0A8J4X245_CLAMG|nr:Thymidylate synthase [Clarias magur]